MHWFVFKRIIFVNEIYSYVEFITYDLARELPLL
jgi:hypothetical protein